MNVVQRPAIAAALRRTTRRYQDCARRLDEARVARDEAVRIAHARGLSLAEIATVTGISRSQLHRIVQRG